MSETNAQEPTMEEILASIRRIISEDEAPAAESEAVAAPHEPPPPAAVAHAPDDVLELTERVEPAKASEPPATPPPAASAPPAPQPLSLGDIDFSSPPPPPPRPAPSSPPEAKDDGESLIAPFAASEAAVHFGQLAQTLAMPAAGRTLEDVVRELLRPLLKDWLEQHLARIVETRVQTEVERISRSRGF